MVAIRTAAAADAATLLALWQALMAEHEAFDPRFRLADDAALRWQNDLPFWLRDRERGLWVAERDGTPVGFAHAHWWVAPPLYAGPDEAYLAEVYVVPEARGHGAGRRLLAAARDWAAGQGLARIRLGVLAANAEALAFWRACGAEPFSVTLTLPVPDGGGG